MNHDYSKFFTDGFKLKQMNTGELKHLTKAEKAQMIKDVIDALDVDLRKYSSPVRRKRMEVMRQELFDVIRENSYDA